VGSRVVVFSRNGHDFTDRFPSIAQLLRELPAKTAVLDGEVVASDADGPSELRQAARAFDQAGAPSTCGPSTYLRSTAVIFVRSRS
jgi:bifunctional non-homologous end joining protein LigD